MQTKTKVLCASLLAALGACTGGPGSGDDAVDAGAGELADADPSSPTITDPFVGLPTGLDQWAALCGKGYGDSISQAFCAGSAPPALTSLADLRGLLGLTIDPNATTQPRVRFTFTGHSTALSARHVSPLNPRAFIFTIPNGSNGNSGPPNPRYQVLAFARGEPMVELVANDPAAGTLRFFLLRFHPACESTGTCGTADLYTPAIESGWTGYTLYDDETIKNTTLDCNQCHQPGGPGTRKLLRMQELAGPWLHWFYPEQPDNLRTIQDYLAAHTGEAYAGIPSNLVQPSRPIQLQRLLTNNGFGTQPNAFDSQAIESELAASGSSPTWQTLYDRAVAGTEIMVPYGGVPQTDPVKVAAAIASYRGVMNGSIPRDQLRSPGDVFADDLLDEMSHRPKPGLDGRGIMRHMCQHCHNSRLDQTQSRAQFNVERLDQLSTVVKQRAITRLMLPEHDARKMPPVRFHTLSDAERDLVIAELQR